MDDFLAQLKEFTSSPEFDWDKAKTFYYVAKIGSQSEAAKILGTSQPSLSRQLSILEEEMKVKLMKRSPFGLILTRQGQELFKSVEHFYLDLKKFRYNHIVLDKAGGKRKIRIAAMHPMAVYLLKGPLFKYTESHPEIIFDIVTEDYDIDLNTKDIDIAILPYKTKEKGISQEPLFKCRKKLFASDAYIKKHGEPKNLADLKNHHVVAYSQPDQHPHADLAWILEVGMPEGKSRGATFTSTSLELLAEAAERGLGIISGYEEMTIMKQCNLKVILPDVEGCLIEGYLAYCNYLNEDQQFLDLKDFLIKEFKMIQEKNQPHLPSYTG